MLKPRDILPPPPRHNNKFVKKKNNNNFTISRLHTHDGGEFINL